MQQFWSIKDQHKDCIILFRMGDFYETFEKDAEITSEILGIALTKRANGAALPPQKWLIFVRGGGKAPRKPQK